VDNPELYLRQFELGPMENYVYFIGSNINKELYIVDPAWEVDSIRKFAEDEGYSIKAALITHGHPDHTNGINELLSTHDIPIYVSQEEAWFYKPIGENIIEVKDDHQVEIGGIKIEFLHTPGHTPGSQCFLVDGKLVAGDTLFLDGCGRCDLPGGNAEIMYETIHNKLMKLPKSTVIYPGHNYHHLKHDTLEAQMQSNPYMACTNLQEFLSARL
jgi:hydroxyacylglutathione hydrolase